MHHMDSAMQSCIDDCLACYRTCTEMAFHRCLEVGGEHVKPEHFTLMAACAEICRAAAQLMLIGSAQHAAVCRACAEICEACATDCERLEGMEACAEACRKCAQSCRAMAG